jgi:hypothetical protein
VQRTNRIVAYSPSLLTNWLLHNRGVFFDKDDNPAGGGNPGGGKDDDTDPTKTTPPVDSEKDKGGAGGGNGDPSKTPEPKPKIEFTAEQQAELNRLLAKEKRDAEKATEKRLKDSAEEEAAKTQGKFQELYDKLNQRVKDELEPKAALADKLSERLHDQIDGEIKDWHSAVKKAIPTREEADVEVRMAAVERNRELQKELSANDRPPRTNHSDDSDKKAFKPEDVVTGKYVRPDKK